MFIVEFRGVRLEAGRQRVFSIRIDREKLSDSFKRTVELLGAECRHVELAKNGETVTLIEGELKVNYVPN